MNMLRYVIICIYHTTLTDLGHCNTGIVQILPWLWRFHTFICFHFSLGRAREQRQLCVRDERLPVILLFFNKSTVELFLADLSFTVWIWITEHVRKFVLQVWNSDVHNLVGSQVLCILTSVRMRNMVENDGKHSKIIKSTFFIMHTRGSCKALEEKRRKKSTNFWE